MAVVQMNGSSRSLGGGVDGRIVGVFISPAQRKFGDPKRVEVESADLTAAGIEGDWCHEKVDANFGGHGGPLKAVCLHSRDVLEALKAEGHAVDLGFQGENISIEGIDWRLVVPGVRLEIGDVLLEVTMYCTPCSKQKAHFKDRSWKRTDHRLRPDFSRMYAAVLMPGCVRRGNGVKLHTDTRGAKIYLKDPKVIGTAIVCKTPPPTHTQLALSCALCLLVGGALGYQFGVARSKTSL